MADTAQQFPEIVNQLTKLPRPGVDPWADLYATDVPKLLAEVTRLSRALDSTNNPNKQTR